MRGRVRIQSRDPLGGGGRHKETGEAPHGHGHRRPLGEVGQGQQHPVAHHGGLACGVERLEHLQHQKQVDGLRTGTIKPPRRHATDQKAFENLERVNNFLAWTVQGKKKYLNPYAFVLFQQFWLVFSHKQNDCTDLFMFLDGNRSPAAICGPAQCCLGNFFCLIAQQNTLACKHEP